MRTSQAVLAAEPPPIRSSAVPRVMEQVLRRVLLHPQRYPLVALAISLGIAAGRHADEPFVVLEMAEWSLLIVLWLPFWVARRTRDPSGRGAVTIALAILGAVLFGRLVAMDVAFAMVALALMPQYYTMLPLWLAVLLGLGPAFGSEVSHRLEVLANPDHFPIGIALLRWVALSGLGVSFKVLEVQAEERRRLQDSLAQAERKAGVLEERQRLAREIHDTLAQGFASIIVHLERAEQIDGLGQSPARGHVDLARSVAREGLEESRRMLAALRPEVLERRALPEALGRVCDDWSRRTGIGARLSVTGSPTALHPEIELTLLRGVQESLTNVARHSGAHTTAVTLSYMEDLIVVDVQDDGRGFAPAAVVGGGFGLEGMRERVEGLQGTLSVESAPGEGTTITLSLPVLRPAGGDAAETAGA